MSERKFEVIDKGNVHSKVTITPDRITVKLGKDETQPEFIIAVAKKIASEVTANQAMRGVFCWETRMITLESDVKSKSKIRQEFLF
jgi:hypothetical protein